MEQPSWAAMAEPPVGSWPKETGWNNRRGAGRATTASSWAAACSHGTTGPSGPGHHRVTGLAHSIMQLPWKPHRNGALQSASLAQGQRLLGLTAAGLGAGLGQSQALQVSERPKQNILPCRPPPQLQVRLVASSAEVHGPPGRGAAATTGGGGGGSGGGSGGGATATGSAGTTGARWSGAGGAAGVARGAGTQLPDEQISPPLQSVSCEQSVAPSPPL